MGYSEEIAEVGKRHRYLLLKPSPINGSAIAYDEVKSSNMKVHLSKLAKPWRPEVSFFIPKGYYISQIRDFSAEELPRLVKDRGIEVITIERLKKA